MLHICIIIYIYTHLYCIDNYDEWPHHQTGDPNTGLNGSSGLVRMGLMMEIVRKQNQTILEKRKQRFKNCACPPPCIRCPCRKGEA